MTYAQIRSAFQRLTIRAVRPGLDRTRWLLHFLGHPDAHCPAIQITGSNGKGSVAAMISSVLSRAGYRVGRFTSPHLVEERERIALNDRMISKKQFVQAGESLLPGLLALKNQGNPATTFEAWTVLACQVFKQTQRKIVVLETGMGGRWDATTAWDKIVLSVLTNISLEHTRELGSTKAEICREKLGILRPGVPLVSAESDPKLRTLMQSYARAQHTQVEFAGQEGDAVFPQTWQRTSKGIRVSLRSKSGSFGSFVIPLAGEFQVRNSALAFLAFKQLQKRGFPLSRQAIARGWEKVHWPGRMEQIHTAPKIILDGAHNPAGVKALTRELLAQGRPVYLVAGVMKDKDVDRMAAEWARLCQKAWTITPPERQRALPAQALAKKLKRQGVSAIPATTYFAALRQAMQAAGKTGVVVVAGSLYNIGPARQAMARLKSALICG